MKQALSIISAAAIFATSVASFATPTTDSGIYVGLSGGLGLMNLQQIQGSTITNNTTTISIHGDHAFTGRIFAGYDLNQYFAVESGYTYFFTEPYGRLRNNTTKAIYQTNTGGNHMVVDLYGKGTLPLVGNFALYSKLGVNLYMARINNVNGQSNKNNINMSFGAGIDYKLTPNVTANCEWLRFNGNARISSTGYQPDADVFLIGLRYRF